VIILLHILAISFSCVTTNIVFPSLLIFFINAITSSDVAESKAPVGSSASRTFG